MGRAGYLKKPYQRKPRRILDINYLKRRYIDDGISLKAIGQELNVTEKVVGKYLVTAGVQLRTRSEAAQQFARSIGRYIPEGGKRLDIHGYVYVKKSGHPRANRGLYVLEHILVWEETHNKPLPKGWLIHHINGIKSDNRPCNLVAMPQKDHLRLLSVKAQRIRELEVENRLLRRALEENQMIFYTEN